MAARNVGTNRLLALLKIAGLHIQSLSLFFLQWLLLHVRLLVRIVHVFPVSHQNTCKHPCVYSHESIQIYLAIYACLELQGMPRRALQTPPGHLG